MSRAASASADSLRAQMIPRECAGRLKAYSLAPASDEGRFVGETEFHGSGSFQKFSARKREIARDRNKAPSGRTLLGEIPRTSASSPAIFRSRRSAFRQSTALCARFADHRVKDIVRRKSPKNTQATGVSHGQPTE